MDAATFVEMAQPLERLLYSVSWSMLSNNEDCADAIQETLAKAWKMRDTLKNTKAFKAWLVRIMVNTCRDMLRRRGDRQFVELEEDMLVTSEAEVFDSCVKEVMASLPPEQRAAVILHYVEGYKLREIAEMLDLPMGTVKTRLLYARNAMKRQLEERTEKGGVQHDRA